jgi:hypothetical protein
MQDLRHIKESHEPMRVFSDVEAATFAYENGPVTGLQGHRCPGGLVLAMVTRHGKQLGPAVLPPLMVEELIALLRKQKFLPPA